MQKNPIFKISTQIFLKIRGGSTPPSKIQGGGCDPPNPPPPHFGAPDGDTNVKNNYRPIAIVTAMSKIFELCLSRIMDAYLFTSDNQFGFKRKHSTDLSIYTV